ncbi:MAG: hypothetical protein J5I99_03660 [Verrucomicrobia bacterium]|nr:hypothetical protein [Verrucomicrobiota bacterium]
MNTITSIALALKSATILTALFYIPGLSWVWLFHPRTRIGATAWAIALGLPAILLPSIALAEFGLFSWTALWVLAAAITLLGLAVGRARHYCYGRAGIAVLSVILFAVFLWPNRGEWIAGGWDPGVNTNQGLLLARTGRLAQPQNPAVATLLREAPQAFARDRAGFTEVFPGFPVDPESGGLRPYFYRATPTFIAIAKLAAGRDAALRANHVLWIFALALFVALLASADIPPLGIGLGALALLLHPIVLAHTATPASEMLELALVCATGLLLCSKERAAPILLFGILLLASLNRASFLFHQAILLLVLVGWDAGETDRRVVTIRHLAIASSLLAGIAWYTWVAPNAVVKLQHLRPVFGVLTMGSLATFLMADSLFAIWKPKRTLRLLAFAGLTALLLRELLRATPWDEFLGNASAWLAYAPPVAVVLAAIGCALHARKSPLAPWLIWLLTALFLVLLRRHTAELYPWATKRWLAFSPPLLAAGAALMLHAAHTRSRLMRGLATAVVLLALGSTLPRARAAWQSTEYNGAVRALDAIASNIRSDDIVVSDHFLWGTPLALAYGATVLNAEPLLDGRGSSEEVARALAQSHRRILFLTSTRREMAIWPPVLQGAYPLTDAVSLSTTTRIQHRKNRGFERQNSSSRLRLFLWTPTP